MVIRLVSPRQLLNLVFEPEGAEEVVGLLERSGMSGLDRPELGRRPQPLDRRRDVGAGLQCPEAGDIDDGKQPAVLDVEGPAVLAGVLDRDVAPESGRYLLRQRKTEHRWQQR